MTRPKRRLAAGIGVVAMVGAALWMRELASWRPTTLNGIGGWSEELTVSRDGNWVWMGEVGGVGQAFTLGPIEEKETNRVSIPPECRDFQLYKGLETWPRLIRRYDGTHFQMKHAAPEIIVARSWNAAFSLARREIYTERYFDEQDYTERVVSIWGLESGKLKRVVRYGLTDKGHDLLSPDGKWLLSAQHHDTQFPSRLRRYEVQSGKPMATPDIFNPNGGLGRLKFSPDGRYFLVGPGLNSPRALIFDASTWKLAWRADGIINADWLPDNCVGITQPQGLEWRNEATGKIEQTRFGPLAGTRFWTTSPDGKWIYAGKKSGEITRWRAK